MKDKQYVTDINDTIQKVKEQYAVMVYNRQQLQNIALKDLQFTISDQLFQDVLLMEIRSKTNAYSSKKKKKKIQKKIKGKKKSYRTWRTKLVCQKKRIDCCRKKDSLVELRKRNI